MLSIDYIYNQVTCMHKTMLPYMGNVRQNKRNDKVKKKMKLL